MKYRMVEEYGSFAHGATIRAKLQVRTAFGWWRTHATFYDLNDARVAWHHITSTGVVRRVVWEHDTTPKGADDYAYCRHTT